MDWSNQKIQVVAILIDIPHSWESCHRNKLMPLQYNHLVVIADHTGKLLMDKRAWWVNLLRWRGEVFFDNGFSSFLPPCPPPLTLDHVTGLLWLEEWNLQWISNFHCSLEEASKLSIKGPVFGLENQLVHLVQAHSCRWLSLLGNSYFSGPSWQLSLPGRQMYDSHHCNGCFYRVSLFSLLTVVVTGQAKCFCRQLQALSTTPAEVCAQSVG